MNLQTRIKTLEMKRARSISLLSDDALTAIAGPTDSRTERFLRSLTDIELETLRDKAPGTNQLMRRFYAFE